MSLHNLLNRPCVIEHQVPSSAKDDYGNEIPTTVTHSTVCDLQQRQRREGAEPGAMARSEWLLVLPAGTAIGPGDTVTVDGQTYEVFGDPWPARNPRTRAVSHLEATLVQTKTAAGHTPDEAGS